MEPKTNDKKVRHQLYEVQFSDEAIIKLKHNKKNEKRHRVKVHLKNGRNILFGSQKYKELSKALKRIKK